MSLVSFIQCYYFKSIITPQLLRYLKAEQAETELTLRRARLGAAPKPPRRKYRAMDATVQRLTAAYDSGEVPALQFLEELSEVVQQMRRRRQH